jgi:hypothetical protein
MSDFFRLFVDLVQSKSRANLSLALLAALLIGAFGWAIIFQQPFHVGWGGKAAESPGGGPTFGPGVDAVAFVTFVLLFFLIWFILHLTTQREGEDIYSVLRDKLVGTYSIYYEIRNGPKKPNLAPTPHQSTAAIGLDEETRKLVLIFNTRNHQIFEDSERQTVDAVSLRRDTATSCTLTYYISGKRHIKKDFGGAVVYGNGPLDAIDIEIFGNLSFSAPRGAKHISSMKGHWFDLNGNLTRLFSLYEDYRTNFEKGVVPELDFHKAHIGSHNFSALMGDIEYRRVDPAD